MFAPARHTSVQTKPLRSSNVGVVFNNWWHNAPCGRAPYGAELLR